MNYKYLFWLIVCLSFYFHLLAAIELLVSNVFGYTFIFALVGNVVARRGCAFSATRPALCNFTFVVYFSRSREDQSWRK